MNREPKVYLAASAFRINPPSLAEGLRTCCEAVAGPLREARKIYLASILESMSDKEAAWSGEAVAPAFDRELARHLDGRAPQVRIDTACTSGAVALGLASLSLQAGEAASAAVVAYEEKTRFNTSGFAALRTLAPGRSMPFTPQACGFTLAAGVGVGVLSTAPGPDIAIRGFAFTNDAHHPTGPHREGDGLRRCIEACLARSGLDPQQVDGLKLNGTGAPYSDAAEHKALRAVFGERLPAIPAYVLKPCLGHLQGASGLIETLIAARYLSGGLIPPAPGFVMSNLTYELGFSAHVRRAGYRNVLLVFGGFGGQNACLVLERPT